MHRNARAEAAKEDLPQPARPVNWLVACTNGTSSSASASPVPEPQVKGRCTRRYLWAGHEDSPVGCWEKPTHVRSTLAQAAPSCPYFVLSLLRQLQARTI